MELLKVNHDFQIFVGMACRLPMIVDPDDETKCCHSDSTNPAVCKNTGEIYFSNIHQTTFHDTLI